MLAASPSQFETMVQRVLARRGYKLIVVGRSGDQGVDLRGSGPNGEKVVVQCKRYQQATTLGPRVIRELAGTVVMQHVDIGIMVTTTFFSKNALAEAASAHVKLLLVDATLLGRLAGSNHHLTNWSGGSATEDLPKPMP